MNSGNANACTGEPGCSVARRNGALGSRILGISAHQLLVASTGVIGVQLPFERLEKQAGALKEGLKPEAIGDVAKAIMTTDTVRKVCSAQVPIAGKPVWISGMTKGAGMIQPNMATTLAFVLTDAMITRSLLEDALTEACNKSYNRISVDGDTSTNDTLAVIANGASGCPLIDDKGSNYELVCRGIDTSLPKPGAANRARRRRCHEIH